MKIGLLGLGAISSFFLQAVEADPSFTLAAVCDLDETKLPPHDARGVQCYTEIDEFLAASGIEAVIITLPNDLHATATIAALERGIHVCCEKPLAILPDEAVAMQQASRSSRATLFTAFHRRYNRHIRDLATRLPSDRREIVRVSARYHENIAEHTGGDRWYLDPVRCGGGCLIDNGPNALDTLRHLLGPLQVQDATVGDVRAGAEFYASVSLKDAYGVPVHVELDWTLETGEIKDIQVELRDGRVLTADMLSGFTAFKSSLDHEYQGILTEFRSAIGAGERWLDPGPDIVQLVNDAYRIARRKEVRLRMPSKAQATARLIKLMFHSKDERAMTLSPWASRCVPAGQIHELITTVDRPSRPGDRVDRVGFLGFAEFHEATVIERGDEVFIDGRRIGTVEGFDECHTPNHYNILIGVDRVVTAGDLNLRVGDRLRFLEASR